MNKQLQKGRAGEIVAQQFVQQKGITLLQTNFKSSHGELDIIGLENKTLVIVEVKHYQAKYWRQALEKIREQSTALQYATEDFISQNKLNLDFEEVRFDALLLFEDQKVFYTKAIF